MINDLLNDLNVEQKAAVMSINSPTRVLAGAGSGKTKVLTKKIAYIVESNVDPSKIMALTFTNKAANEMKQRVEMLIGYELTNKMTISTFHSLCASFLRKEIHNLQGYKSDFLILDGTDQIDVLKEIYKNNGISSNDISYFSSLEFISYHKNNETDIDEMRANSENDVESIKIEIFDQYQKTLNNSKSLDFDDLQLFTRRILREFPKILEKWQSRFEYFLVDEFQDTSKVQYDIISTLAKSQKITIVGDPDQTIYSWRGADISFINNFDKLFPNSTTIILSRNYRSTKNILFSANKLIANNINRIPKSLITENEDGEKINCHTAASPETESMWVVSKINELRKQRVQLKDIVILYRSNYYSRSIEDALISNLIPHKIIGGQRFYERAEIKDCLSFLRSIWKPNDISLKRIINVPTRKIGDSTIKKISNFASEKGMSIWDSWIQNFNELKLSNEVKVNLFTFINQLRKYNAILNNHNPIYKTLEEFLYEIGYMSLVEQNSTSTNDKLENVKELLKSIHTWEKQNPDKNIDDYLEEISLVSLSNGNEDDNVNYVSLMTVHAAKGLEFKYVFVIGMNEEIFPSQKTLINDNDNENEKLEEERRLAYVAITRAKEKLFLSCIRGFSYDTKQIKKPSRFLFEMGLKFEDYEDRTAEMILEANMSKKDRDFHPGDKIFHTNFGEGIVLDISGDTIIIEFKKNIGIKQLLKNHKSIEKV